MINQKAKLHNRFDFEIYDTETGETEHAQAENIVLNSAWDDLSGITGYIHVGTGTGTLSPTRNSLFTHLLGKATTDVETVYDTDKTAHKTVKTTFNESEANGAWTEVGLANYYQAGWLKTHALITDSEGSSITVNKTNTKIITVYATVFATILEDNPLRTGENNLILNYLMGSDDSGEFFFSSMLTKDGGPSWIMSHSSLAVTWNSNSATKKRYTNLHRLPVDSGNFPIRGIGIFSSYGRKAWGGVGLPSAVFSQANYTGIPVGTGDGSEDEFDLPLSFIKPNSETIYVNGVAKVRGVDYTVHYGLISTATTVMESVSKAMVHNSPFEEVIEIPQPVGGTSNITKIELKNSSEPYHRAGGYAASLSMGGETWVPIGEVVSGWARDALVSLTEFANLPYKYLKLKFYPYSYYKGNVSWVKVFAQSPGKSIKFTTPPASGHPITADFATEYINKTSNFVLDVQAEVVFGEGT